MERPRAGLAGGAALYYLEQAGSHRNPTWANLDFLALYRFKFGAKSALVFEGKVFNLFNNQEQTATDSVQDTDFRSLAVAPFIQPGTILNPFFGTGNSYTAGTRLVLTVRADF